MDLSLLQNFQTLIGTSLKSIVDDARIQYDNLKEELTEQINHFAEKNIELEQTVKELTSKIDEHIFSEDNFNRVSIISNLNKQIKQLKNENGNLRNCLNKNMPMNPSLARAVTPSNSIIEEDVPINQREEELVNEEVKAIQSEEEVVPDKSTFEEVTTNQNEEEEALGEIEYNSKTYYIIDGKLYNKKKDGSQGKHIGKMVDGKPKLKKKRKTTAEKN